MRLVSGDSMAKISLGSLYDATSVGSLYGRD